MEKLEDCNKTTVCPSSARLPFVCSSSPRVFLLTDSELQRHLAKVKLSPGAKVEARLAASGHSESALVWEYFTDTLQYFINIYIYILA